MSLSEVVRATGRVLCCVLLFVASPAWAQDEASAAASAAATEDAAPADPRLEEAMERYADANALFERGDHAGALSEMERVYQLLEGTPNQYVVLYNLGRVHEELFRYDRAIELYQRYLAEAPADAPDRADAEASLRALDRLLGTVSITTNAPDTTAWLGEIDLGLLTPDAPLVVRIPAGHHALELRAPGYEAQRREVDVVARTEQTVAMTLAEIGTYRGITPAVFGTTAALTLVSAGVAIGIGVYALQLHGDSNACTNTMGCSFDVPARMRELSDLALAADLMWGATAVLGITTVVLAFVTDFGGDETEASARLVPLPGGAMLVGQF